MERFQRIEMSDPSESVARAYNDGTIVDVDCPACGPTYGYPMSDGSITCMDCYTETAPEKTCQGGTLPNPGEEH